MKKRISVLGTSGSIGVSTARVIEAFPDRFQVVLLAAHRSRDVLLAQARRYHPEVAAIGSEEDAAWLRAQLADTDVQVVHGRQGLLDAIARVKAHLTISAIVGAAGLEPTLAAIRSGSHIGLANKESMVVAGPLMNREARAAGVTILPVDSEHNALHQCLRGEKVDEVKRLILTASGGPFRTYTGSFEEITVAQALKHPTWDMGRKITIDSATMMNKGLEVIEAHHLFGFPGDRIDIVVHPGSVVHSMIETVDGSYKAQFGRTDMCEPIQYAMAWPDRWPQAFDGFDVTRGLTLEFHPVDKVRFPCIQLAYDALNGASGAPAVLNAANEVTVAAFLDERIRFTDIARLNARCLDQLGGEDVATLDQILDLDSRARGLAVELVGGKK